MPPKLPKPVWNLLAVFFAAWCAAAAWLLIGGESSPMVRFAFALCGAAILFAGSVGGLFRPLGRGLWRGLRWLFSGKRGTWLTVAALLTFLWAFFAPIFWHSDEKVRSTSTISDMKNEGLALLFYAEGHNDILPPDMRDGYIDVSLATHLPYRDFGKYPPYGKPYVWCKELAGLKTTDIAEPDKVVVAYSRAHKPFDSNNEEYTLLFLDGHVKGFMNRQKLLDQLRERPALIAYAVRTKAKRYAGVKSLTMKVAP